MGVICDLPSCRAVAANHSCNLERLHHRDCENCIPVTLEMRMGALDGVASQPRTDVHPTGPGPYQPLLMTLYNAMLRIVRLVKSTAMPISTSKTMGDLPFDQPSDGRSTKQSATASELSASTSCVRLAGVSSRRLRDPRCRPNGGCRDGINVTVVKTEVCDDDAPGSSPG